MLPMLKNHLSLALLLLIAPAAFPATATVRQGHLENANLETIDELVELIAAQRAFESASQAFKTIDQSFSRLYR